MTTSAITLEARIRNSRSTLRHFYSVPVPSTVCDEKWGFFKTGVGVCVCVFQLRLTVLFSDASAMLLSFKNWQKRNSDHFNLWCVSNFKGYSIRGTKDTCKNIRNYMRISSLCQWKACMDMPKKSKGHSSHVAFAHPIGTFLCGGM